MSCYLALDGPDGCGKSSQAAALVAWLGERGRRALHVREPGSTPVGEALRALLLSPATGELRPISEALLFSAARAELMANVVAPALARGDVVVAERCDLSTVVYQGLAHQGPAHPGAASAGGAGHALTVDWLFDLTRRVHGACLPDAVFVLDVPVAVSLARRAERTRDRFEARGDDYHERVRHGYLRASQLDGRARVVDAARAFDAVQADLRAALMELLR
ncbi:MAG: dTMP kinase [Planctomycetota bacterium]